MRLVLARHAETVWHHENRYAGSSDVALTAAGLAQAERLAEWASTAGLAAVWSSPQSRATATAAPSARAAGVPLRTDDRLREVAFGRGEGLTRAEMHRRFPADLAAYLAEPASVPLPGGERGTDAIARAMPALEEIGAAHPDGTVLVVMHSTLMRLLLCAVIGVAPDRYREVFPAVGNAALTELRWEPGRAGLVSHNVPPVAR
ncbi:histidine phosphatase family protein [Agromyces sp. G08B096]|uniref:Histidine phosphatase family protein n=1 Tax=Agromyces sp. G08B096 TaxID=3156399 RepID=A0AAU7W816_9MICO